VIPRRSYDLSHLIAETRADIVLASRIDCIDYDKVDVLVRIHSLDIGPGQGSFEVQVGSDGYTCEDPERNPPFVAPLGAIIINTGEEGAYKAIQLTGSLGSMLWVNLACKQDTLNTTSLSGEFSVDLVFKP
jgi:hypothetical protein